MPSTHRLLIDRRRGKDITRVIGFDNKVIEYTDAYIFCYGLYNQDGNITEEIRKKMQQAVETYYTAPCYRMELIDITESNVNQYLSEKGKESNLTYLGDHY